MTRLLVLGSANIDLSVRVEHIAAPGETVLGEDALTTPGGKGANAAVAAGKAARGLEAKVHFAGAVGQDAYGQLLRGSLEAAGLDTAHLIEVDAPTGIALIAVSGAGENAITVASGANRRLTPAHVPPLEGYAAVTLQLESPLETVQAAATAARKAGVRVVLNAAPARALPGGLLEQVNVLVVNRGELTALSGHVDLEQGATRMLECGIGQVIVTLGAGGVYARSADGLEHRVPAFAVQVTDTTGAGDTFCGVLTLRLSLGDPLERALRYASAAAALTCTRPGAQAAMPWREEIEALLGRG